jgi:mannose/cellobiose epimerase-like protein (N-acyl-D-glucosamine 2-epimerase family)
MPICLRADRSRSVPATGSGHKAIRDFLAKHLDNEVLPFWVSAKLNDIAFGGYLPYLDNNLRPTGKVQGHVIVQLRVLYVHAVAISRAANGELRTKLLRQYQRKFAFLKQNYWDEKNGGFRDYSIDSSRSPKQTRSQVHAINFLTEIYLLIDQKEAFELARDLFSLIDNRAHDKVYGGYTEYYEIPSDDALNKVKTLSVQMHMLLALTRLYQATRDPLYRDRFEEIFEILTRHFEIPNSGKVYNALSYNWEEIPPNGKLETKTVYGHSAELIWYMLEVVPVFQKDINKLIPWLTRVTDALLATGVTSDGAVYFSGSYRGAAEEKTIWWWAQAETMVALLRVYEVTREIRYWAAFEKVRLWTFRYMVPDQSGTWVTFMDTWGFRRASTRAGGHWQSGFHVSRALLQCIQTFDRLNAHTEARMFSR